jgi:hypothetical protein
VVGGIVVVDSPSKLSQSSISVAGSFVVVVVDKSPSVVLVSSTAAGCSGSGFEGPSVVLVVVVVVDGSLVVDVVDGCSVVVVVVVEVVVEVVVVDVVDGCSVVVEVVVEVVVVDVVDGCSVVAVLLVEVVVEVVVVDVVDGCSVVAVLTVEVVVEGSSVVLFVEVGVPGSLVVVVVVEFLSLVESVKDVSVEIIEFSTSGVLVVKSSRSSIDDDVVVEVVRKNSRASEQRTFRKDLSLHVGSPTP